MNRISVAFEFRAALLAMLGALVVSEVHWGLPL